MRLIAPDYYSSFACLMDKCHHTCCAGWEIDIDEDTLNYYQSLHGEMGKRIMENIDTEGEYSHFRLTADERCPFLDECGLCELILKQGEEALCQICADHPRFRNFFSDRTEIGLGMCCEAAARLILTHQSPTVLIEIDADNREEWTDADEQELLTLRAELMNKMQNRSLSMEYRVEQLAQLCGISTKQPLSFWKDLLLSLERLDDTWTEQLYRLSDEITPSLSSEWDIPLEQFMVYLLYRHLPSALENGNIEEYIAFCVMMWYIVRALFAVQEQQTMDTLIELCRMYSSEIEYSEENISVILNTLCFSTPL